MLLLAGLSVLGLRIVERLDSMESQVTDLSTQAIEAEDEELERKLVQRVKLFKFKAKDVASVTTTKPIDFFPA